MVFPLLFNNKNEAKRYLYNLNYNFLEEDEEEIIECLMYEQYYKSYKAYKKNNYICHIPELTNTIYTKNKIKEEYCFNIEWLTNFVFESIDWQGAPTMMDELESMPCILDERYDEVFGIENK